MANKEPRQVTVFTIAIPKDIHSPDHSRPQHICVLNTKTGLQFYCHFNILLVAVVVAVVVAVYVMAFSAFRTGL